MQRARGRGQVVQQQRKRSAETVSQEDDEDVLPSETTDRPFLNHVKNGDVERSQGYKWIVRCDRVVKREGRLTALDIVWNKVKQARTAGLLPDSCGAKVSTAMPHPHLKDSPKNNEQGVVIVYGSDSRSHSRVLSLAMGLERLELRGLVMCNKRDGTATKDSITFKTDRATKSQAKQHAATGQHGFVPHASDGGPVRYKYNRLFCPSNDRSLVEAGKTVGEDRVVLTAQLLSSSGRAGAALPGPSMPAGGSGGAPSARLPERGGGQGVSRPEGPAAMREAAAAAAEARIARQQQQQQQQQQQVQQMPVTNVCSSPGSASDGRRWRSSSPDGADPEEQQDGGGAGWESAAAAAGGAWRDGDAEGKEACDRVVEGRAEDEVGEVGRRARAAAGVRRASSMAAGWVEQGEGGDEGVVAAPRAAGEGRRAPPHRRCARENSPKVVDLVSDSGSE